MRSPERRLPWAFLAAFAAATLTQGVGAKLVIRLVNGSLPDVILPGLAILAGAYALLVIGLVRLVGDR
ncbi:MAG: hypothetical protein QN141_05310 [Armatimonadota bacterium]|nr:hypothetical protein [Armatimonadota bacterium]MDR7451331.1 hypothetical protein [Armatimonadota bacterium]MDR7466765.1 hypothetical protein [Armatimonadota bacterium]MDR7492761.1 hypothetical protein [Armatimonadota bacterium]MDR7498537.1 hypothetical protein [Armatimonadota bacterium]